MRFLTTCAQMLMHEIAHEGCADTVTESVLCVRVCVGGGGGGGVI